MIRVALFSHSPGLAGAERMLFNMALLLKNTNKYEPVVFIPDSNIKNFYMACEENNILAVLLPNFAQYIFVSDENKNEISNFALDCMDDIANIIYRHSIDVMIANTATSIIPPLVASKLNIPIIGWIHGILDSYLIDSFYSNERRLYFDRMFIAICDTVICCSDWTTRYYKKYNLTSVQTLYNWTPKPKEIKRMDLESNTFVCLNTFDQNKGIMTLLKAGLIIKQTYDDFKIYIYGDGNSNIINEAIEFISTNKLENNVYINKRTNNISAVYNESLCLVQPSFIESFGMTIIEAMSFGRPVISAKAGGPEDIIVDGKTGFLVDKNDPKQLAQKMIYLLDNKTIAKEMGEYGKDIYNKKFSPKSALENLEKLLANVIMNYHGVSKSKQLYIDSIMMLLKTEKQNFLVNKCNTHFNEVQCSDNTIVLTKEINSEYLVFSKPIKKIKKYSIMSPNYAICNIGIIFTTLDNKISNGTLTLNIYVEDILLRTSKKELSSIINNQWTYFTFNEIKSANKKQLLIELVFNYEKGSNKFGVYEDTRNRNFRYKVFNKLRMSEKGLDILFTDCR